MVSVLLIDDDVELTKLLEEYLQSEQFHLDSAHDGPGGLQKALAGQYAVVVLDVMLPGMSGLDVLKQLRQKSTTPVLMLTARGSELDRILGLELGADDYVVKPFSPRELVARVKAVLRRKGSAVETEQKLTRGKLSIDAEEHVAAWAGSAVALTATEFALLKAIAAQPRRAFTRENLMAAAYPDARFVSDRTIDSHIRHIRAKFQALGGDPIETVHGVGYKLAAL